MTTSSGLENTELELLELLRIIKSFELTFLESSTEDNDFFE